MLSSHNINHTALSAVTLLSLASCTSVRNFSISLSPILFASKLKERPPYEVIVIRCFRETKYNIINMVPPNTKTDGTVTSPYLLEEEKKITPNKRPMPPIKARSGLLLYRD